MKVLNYDQAHAYVERNKHFAYWEGWDLMLFRPTSIGYSKKNGAFRNNKWGIQTRISPDSNGNWNVR